MSQSIPYQLSQAVVAALRSLEDQGVTVHDNPTSRAAISAGARVVFVEDMEDGPRGQPNQAEQRTFSLTIGVINRTASARADCDADALLCKGIIEPAILAAGRSLVQGKALVSFAAPREGRRVYRIEGIDVGGALIVTQFDIDYTVPNTNTRGRA